MIHNYRLDNGADVLLCSEHAKLMRRDITLDQGREAGGKWQCHVCSVHRRLTRGQMQPVSVLIESDTTNRYYTVTRYPETDTSTGRTVQVTHCTCKAWQFQKGKPAWERWCKHMGYAADRLDRLGATA